MVRKAGQHSRHLNARTPNAGLQQKHLRGKSEPTRQKLNAGLEDQRGTKRTYAANCPRPAYAVARHKRGQTYAAASSNLRGARSTASPPARQPGHPWIDCPNFSSRSLDARPGADLGVATGWLEHEVVGTARSLACWPQGRLSAPLLFWLVLGGHWLRAPRALSFPAVLLLAPSGLYLLLGYLRGLGLAPSSSASCASPIWVEGVQTCLGLERKRMHNQLKCC